jgi:hypothetical protein
VRKKEANVSNDFELWAPEPGDPDYVEPKISMKFSRSDWEEIRGWLLNRRYGKAENLALEIYENLKREAA